MTWLDLLKRIISVLVLTGLVALVVSRAVGVVEDARQEGYQQGAGKAQAEGEVVVERLRTMHAEAAADAARQAEADAKEAAKRLQEEQQRADRLAAELATQQRKHRTTTDRLTGEIARVNDLYREALDAQPKPLPACVFTAGWVRVYDEATGTILPQTGDSSRAAAPTTEARAAEQLDSGLNQSQVLEHHVRYAEQCRNITTQLDLLIDHLRGK